MHICTLYVDHKQVYIYIERERERDYVRDYVRDRDYMYIIEKERERERERDTEWTRGTRAISSELGLYVTLLTTQLISSQNERSNLK
jgi:hypothetical protein